MFASLFGPWSIQVPSVKIPKGKTDYRFHQMVCSSVDACPSNLLWEWPPQNVDRTWIYLELPKLCRKKKCAWNFFLKMMLVPKCFFFWVLFWNVLNIMGRFSGRTEISWFVAWNETSLTRTRRRCRRSATRRDCVGKLSVIFHWWVR